MHPLIIVTVDGKPISTGGAFMDQLLSLTVTDNEGAKSDTLQLEFNASRFTSVPRQKANIQVWMGYRETGTAYFGSFEVNDAELRAIPYIISVSAKASDMRTELKTNKSRHWDDTTLGSVLSELATENGLQPVISGAGAGFQSEYWAMEDESVIHFAERQARRHNATFTIKDGKFIFVDKGSGMSASGQALGGLVITPEMVIVGSLSVKFSGRDAHKKVEAAYHDKKKAKREIVSADGLKDSEGTLRLRHAFSSREEAESAAKSHAKDLQRAAESTTVDIEGNIAARGGVPMSYAGIHPQVDGTPFIIETAGHSYDKSSGYKTNVSAKVKV